MAYRLELVPQCELHFARRRGLLKFTEGERGRQGQTRIREIHRVKRVERFCTETDGLTLFGQFKGLLKSQIGVKERS